MDLNKVCTGCGLKLTDKNGRPVQELYDEDLFLKSKILRLVECKRCSQPADKYIELEGVLVLIDLVLLRPEAFRHVLFNEVAYKKLIFKMTIITVICDGYIQWSDLESAGEFFEQEFQFYIKCTEMAISLAGFLAVCLMSSAIGIKNISECTLGLLMSYSARFCNLAAFLWASNSHDASYPLGMTNFMWKFIYLLFFTSTVRSVQVTQTKSLGTCLIIGFVAHLVFNVLVEIGYFLT